MKAALQDLNRIIEEKDMVCNPEEVEKLEKEVISQTDRLAGLIIGIKLQESINSQELKQESSELIKALPQKMKNQGPKNVKVRFLRGEPIVIKINYFTLKAKKDRRKKNRHGCYPAFVLLGVHDRCSPGLSSEISLMATALGSFEEARNVLLERGVDLTIKTIRSTAVRFAERSRNSQQFRQDEFAENVSGCRVVISTDGGRIRMREKKTGPKTKKGRNRYKTSWREPKILIIYTVDENGCMNKVFTPFIDGTLKGPDAVFSLIEYYLKKININQADKILFVADGARWIWNRVEKLMNSPRRRAVVRASGFLPCRRTSEQSS